MTRFGDAYFRQVLPRAASFRDAFDRARTFVRMREMAEGRSAFELAPEFARWREQRAMGNR